MNMQLKRTVYDDGLEERGGGILLLRAIAKLLYCRTGISVVAMVLPALLTTPAVASVTISSATTKNVICSGGVCSPTKSTAVLNVSDLETMLASGDVTVTTTGTAQATNIVVAASLTWSSPSNLALSATQSIGFYAPISVTGKGGLALNDAGTESLAFYDGANVTFAKLSSALTINGNAYVLVNSVAGLAGAANANPSGDYALASSYDAGRDGTYSSAPVQNPGNWFTGIFEGLGNSISNLTIVDGTPSAACDGLIFSIYSPIISNVGMVNVSITSTGDQGANGAGAVACGPNGNSLIWRSYATGTITMGRLDGAGGLCACGGAIVQSWANVAISGGQGSSFGGLTSGATLIDQSFSMGSVSCTAGFCQLGGLSEGVGQGGKIMNSYSISALTDGGPGGDDSHIGGLLSQTDGEGSVVQSYAAGKITTPDSGCNNNTDCMGGLYGVENGTSNKDVYWDATTAGVNVAAGNEGSDPGTKGLKNGKFVKKLPKGLDKKIWAQNPALNNGLPYLIINPPPQ
jgi:hypothetical protein